MRSGGIYKALINSESMCAKWHGLWEPGLNPLHSAGPELLQISVVLHKGL